MVIDSIDANPDMIRIHDSNPAVLPQQQSEFEAMILESVLKSECIDEHFEDTSMLLHRQNDAWFQSILPKAPLAQNEQCVERLSHSTEPSKPFKEIDHSASSVDAFVTAMWPYLKKASESVGLDPKILLAQAALETGWGKFILKNAEGASSYNVFNIKSTDKHSQQPVVVKTTEYIDNTPVKLTAAFRSYQSFGESLQDYLSLIEGSPRYQEAVAHADSPARYVQALQKAGYATDPDYAHKILSIYHGEALQQVLARNGLI